jgi:hypothetical protein
MIGERMIVRKDAFTFVIVTEFFSYLERSLA